LRIAILSRRWRCGSETSAGVFPKKAIDAVDAAFTIPLYGFSQSLNLSVSAGIVLHHVAQTLRSHGDDGDLPTEKRRLWLARCMLESVERPEALLRELYARRGRRFPL
jgi:tRNA (guanosine-2'-O-)-methyltransferase